ncbi:MAG: hypothetical protein AAF623_02370 [Planctomycetota bacterium]
MNHNRCNPNPIFVLALLGVSGWWMTAIGMAQFVENFESGKPSWQKRDTDCILLKSNWIQRRSNEIDQKNRFEKIYLNCGQGTQILVAHDIPPAYVISELRPSLRIKASKAGIRLMVRVVLPRTPAPNGEGPMTTLLSCQSYSNMGKWQTVGLAENTDLKEQLNNEIWLLRRKFGPEVTARDAFVDKVVLNLYTSPGELNVQIDDLIVTGTASAQLVAEYVEKRGIVREEIQSDPSNSIRPASFQDPVGAITERSHVAREGSVLVALGKPIFPVIVQHNGESLQYLKALGFNVIEMNRVANSGELRQAAELNLWIICPPPNSVGLSPIGFEYDRVLCWKVGDQLSGQDLDLVAQRIREVRESDSRKGRPVVGNVADNWTRIGRMVDVLGIGKQPLGSSFFASQYSDWIRQRIDSVGSAKPVWVDIQTELSESISSQVRSIATQIPPIPVEPQQVKFLVYEAITGGARGLRFLSRQRLDGPDPASRLRAQTLEWLNAHIEKIRPWALGGALMGEVATGTPNVEVTALNTQRSRLLLIQKPTHHEQYLVGDTQNGPISFVDPSTFANQVYLISATGLKPISSTRDHSGSRVQIENCSYCCAVVLTEDAQVVRLLNESYERVGRRSEIQLHRELTQKWLAIMQLINGQLGRVGRASTAGSSHLNEAVTAFKVAESLLEGQTPESAEHYLHRCDQQLALTKRDWITNPLGSFQSKTSTPFATHASLIPLHWDLVNRLQGSNWNPNGLAGGDFENLELLMANGWSNQKIDDEALVTQVELSPNARVEGKLGLQMQVLPNGQGVGLVESSPLWIKSPEVKVRRGELVRIHGWVNIPDVIEGSHDGLEISDSLGGRGLRERLTVTRGWQEFTLYRGVPADGSLSVKFTLTGIGTAMLDEVTIRTIELNTP